MRQYSLFIIICILMAAAVLLNVACNNQKEEPEPSDEKPITTKPLEEEDPPTPEQLAERAKIAEQVKKAFEANYRIEKTATGYNLGGTKFNDETSNALFAKNGWVFVINQKEKRTIEITAPGVGTAKFKFDNFGNLTVIEDLKPKP